MTIKKAAYAEDVGHYWKTSTASPDTWLDKAKKLIASIGGKIVGEGFLNDVATGRAAYLLSFQAEGETYHIKWPVLPTRQAKDEKAARVQAATMLYHDVKARCVNVKVRGVRFAFLNYYALPTGQTVSEAADEALIEALPTLFRPRLQAPPER